MVFLSDARQLEVRLLLFYMPCHATKFVLLSVFTLIDDLPNDLAKPWPKNTNIHFLLTCVAQKSLTFFLSSQFSLPGPLA